MDVAAEIVMSGGLIILEIPKHHVELQNTKHNLHVLIIERAWTFDK